MKGLSLNHLQIQHQTDRTGCEGLKCAVPGCNKCLCGKRSDAKYCCDEHKCELHNDQNAVKDHHLNQWKSENKKNARIFVRLRKLGVKTIDFRGLFQNGINFNIPPVSGIWNGKTVGLYDTVAVWVDDKLIIHIEDI